MKIRYRRGRSVACRRAEDSRIVLIGLEGEDLLFRLVQDARRRFRYGADLPAGFSPIEQRSVCDSGDERLVAGIRHLPSISLWSDCALKREIIIFFGGGGRVTLGDVMLKDN